MEDGKKAGHDDPTLVKFSDGRSAGDGKTPPLSGDEPTAALSSRETEPHDGSARDFPVSNWGRYKFLKFLGEGGMGRVYEALDLQLHRSVALKFIRGADPEMSRRFLFEARAQAKIHHPNICGVYETGEVEGKLYIAMQLIRGETLGKAAAELSLEQNVALMAEVALGVHEAHRAGLIHRDIKPGNIMVEKREDDRHPVVTDFGLAREAETAGATSTGMIVGTPWYMSPEQARGAGASIDRRSDVYSLGATLYSIIAGRPPFFESSGIDVLVKVLQEDPLPLRKAAVSVPSDLETVVMKCLEKDPGRRYDSAKALAEDLKRWLDGEPVLAKPAGFIYAFAKKARKHKALFAASGAALVMAMTLGIYAVVQKARSTAQARAASRFGRIVEEISGTLRFDAMLPIHDVTPARDEVKKRITGIAGEIADTGKSARGPGLNAMGRACLELKDYENARRYLEEAWREGYREPDVALALGETYGAIYHRSLREIDRGGGQARQKELKKRLEEELLKPALEYLNMAKGKAPGRSPEYAEALMAFYEKRYGEAAEKTDEALRRLPWFFEASNLKGDIFLAEATAEWEKGGDRKKIGELLDSARKAYTGSVAAARSNAPGYAGLCDCWNLAIYISDRYTGEVENAYTRAVKACGDALIAEPGNISALNGLANAHKRWATTLTERGEDPTEALLKCAEEAGKAARLDPGFAYAHLNIGVSRRMLGEYMMTKGEDPSRVFSEAIKSLEEARRLDPNLLHAVNNIGMIWTSRARWEAGRGIDPADSISRAGREFEEALRLDPDFRPAGDNLEKLRMIGSVQAK